MGGINWGGLEVYSTVQYSTSTDWLGCLVMLASYVFSLFVAHVEGSEGAAWYGASSVPQMLERLDAMGK